MTNRRRYLVTYDIADDTRRNEVFKLCRQQGDHTQYSVFIAELDQRELIVFQSDLEQFIHRDQDQILFADLGLAEREAGRIIASLGKPYQPPIRALVV